MKLSGGCRRGQVRYAVLVSGPLASYACHCLDCQTQSGSAFTEQAPLLADRLSASGDMMDWTAERDGATKSHRLCARCFTRVFSTNSKQPGVALLRVGTLDDSNDVVPALHMWVRRKQSWIALPEGTEAYEENPPGDRMKAIFAPNLL